MSDRDRIGGFFVGYCDHPEGCDIENACATSANGDSVCTIVQEEKPEVAGPWLVLEKVRA